MLRSPNSIRDKHRRRHPFRADISIDAESLRLIMDQNELEIVNVKQF